MCLERVAKIARRAIKALQKENGILQDGERPNVIHDLDGSEMGEWEGLDIPLDEFDEVRKVKVESRKAMTCSAIGERDQVILVCVRAADI
jgi:hypothetical protein